MFGWATEYANMFLGGGYVGVRGNYTGLFSHGGYYWVAIGLHPRF